MRSRIDLHVHSTASDGTLTPEELVKVALDSGLEIIAIADHDSTDGVLPALAASKSTNLSVWPAVEISTDVPKSEVHIIGYFVDFRNSHLQEVLRALRQSRRERARRMVDKLAELGMPIDWQRVIELAGGGAVGRPHVAEAMRERGYVSSVTEAFERYIGRNGPAYVERYKLTPTQAVELVVSSGGLPVLAHPLTASGGDHGEPLNLEQVIPELVEYGLVGIEAYYCGYEAEQTQQLLALADKWQLVVTGGSDFHGRNKLGCEIGSVYVPYACAEQLRSAYQAKLTPSRPRPSNS